MSQNSIDACLSFAYRHERSIMLIPSRRQIEASDLGGGYVEGWDTEQFVEYVRKRDPKQLVLLCRDHGGPYQLPQERSTGLSAEQAMKTAMMSFAEDIRCGFDLLHIDTSMDIEGPAPFPVAIDRLVELYGQCTEAARTSDLNVAFEIGFEDQGVDTNDPREFGEQMQDVLSKLRNADLPPPTFVVAQTGTKVQETVNTGALRTAPAAVVHTVRALSALTHKSGSALKAHNADYLSVAGISRLRAAGVHAMNIAPEIGVAETRALLEMLDELGLRTPKESFLEMAYASNLWRKWMISDSPASDFQRAVIAGHYVFGTAEFSQLKAAVSGTAARRGIDLDAYLRWSIEQVISRYFISL
jgi:D-tagatose-1,6-bisphosphate aldolase subunit GatZ/KbaZ-like